MRQLTFIGPGKLEWRDVADPLVESPGEAIVAPVAVATCDLDPVMIRGLLPLEGPFAFGHEAVARVVEIGEAVTVAKPGDLVVVPFQISCGECAPCRRGHTASCDGVKPRLAMYGMAPLAGGRDWGGMLSERVRVPFADAMLVPLPEGIDPVTVASAADNIPDGWRAVVPPLEAFPEASVLVVGGATLSIALYAVAIARALGAEVHYIDRDPDRLALASSFGAQILDGPPPERYGRHLVTVDGSASVEGLQCALRSTAGSGICTTVGSFQNDVPIPLFEMYSTNVTFEVGRVHARPVIPKVLDLVASGTLHPEVITTSVVAYDDVAEALLEPFTKLVVRM